MPTFNPGDKVVRTKHFKPKVPQGVVFTVEKVLSYAEIGETDDIRLVGVSGLWSVDFFALASEAALANVPPPSEKKSGVFAVGDVVIRTGPTSKMFPALVQGGQFTVAKVSGSGESVWILEIPEGTPFSRENFEHVSLCANIEKKVSPFKPGDKVVCLVADYETYSIDHTGFFQKGDVGVVEICGTDLLSLSNQNWWRDVKDFQLATGNEPPVKKPRYVVYNCHSY